MGDPQLFGFVGPSVNWWALMPQIILLGAALAVLLVSALAPQRASNVFTTVTTLCAAFTSFVVAVGLWNDVKIDGPSSSIASAFGVDGFSIFFTVLILIGLATTALLSHGYLEREGMDPPEFHALLLCSAAGAIVMASANDLIVMFLGLEALSIGIYVMIAMHHRRSEARESAIKYFVLGAFSSAFLLYGIALTYGATGSTNLVHVRNYLDTVVFRDQHLLMAAMALLLVGLSFKVAAAPFHFWAPDVYQGAPSPVTGWMASIAKAAGFAALLRIFFAAFASHDVDWAPIVGALAVITLVVGAVMAILQTDVKRMLAFSSVSHAGYILVAVHSASAAGTSAALFYLFTYTLM
ncbi:MAG TPA: NADH-quinone oxidoreductase subunit N, partial [Acidimicrobiaceae bacterium]|nr:NADH-quinone oxidoreductase subunit N [Acidimicrobiaceae bacterium]